MNGTKRQPAIIGCRAHSGWAAVVVLAGTPKAPFVFERNRIALAPPEIKPPVQPYHMARTLTVAEAKRFLRDFTHESERLAREALLEAIGRATEANLRVAGCGIPIGSGRLPDSLQEILASHPALHTAEGKLFRNSIIRAGENLLLPILQVPEREIFERGAAELAMAPRELKSRLAALGESMGPPWGQDQKVSALAAWMALAGLN